MWMSNGIQHFSDIIKKAINILDKFYMKPSNKIFTYDIDFMYYISQLG